MRLFAGILLSVLLVSGAQAWFSESADDEKAHKLFIEAKAALDRLETIEGESLGQLEARLNLLKEVDANLDKIIADYPSSKLAVLLASGPVGGIDARKVDNLVDAFEVLVEASIGAYPLYIQAMSAWSAYKALPTDESEHFEARLTLLKQISLLLRRLQRDYVGSIYASQSDVVAVINAAEGGIPEIEADILCHRDLRDCISVESIRAARSIKTYSARSSALVVVVEAQAASGNIFRALATARSIEDANHRAKALAAVAGAQAASGDVFGALATARSIEDAFHRAKALAAVAGAQAASGDVSGAQELVSEALEVARSIEYAFHRAKALAAVAGAQAASGDVSGAQKLVSEAQEVARNIGNAAERSDALSEVVKALHKD